MWTSDGVGNSRQQTIIESLMIVSMGHRARDRQFAKKTKSTFPLRPDSLSLIIYGRWWMDRSRLLPRSRSHRLTFSSSALWCSKSDLSALSTSTSDETPAGDCACRFITVIRNDRSCRETRHSRCSSSNCNRCDRIWIMNEHLREYYCVPLLVRQSPRPFRVAFRAADRAPLSAFEIPEIIFKYTIRRGNVAGMHLQKQTNTMRAVNGPNRLSDH